jgi:hypothetical protein
VLLRQKQARSKKPPPLASEAISEEASSSAVLEGASASAAEAGSLKEGLPPNHSSALRFLHIDSIACIADRLMNQKRKAPAPPEVKTASLEVFALANTGGSWRDKAYNTAELKNMKGKGCKRGSGLVPPKRGSKPTTKLHGVPSPIV